MTDGNTMGSPRDPILLRLELYLDGETIEDAQVRVSRFADHDPDAGADLSDNELVELACRIACVARETKHLRYSLRAFGRELQGALIGPGGAPIINCPWA